MIVSAGNDEVIVSAGNGEVIVSSGDGEGEYTDHVTPIHPLIQIPHNQHKCRCMHSSLIPPGCPSLNIDRQS